MPDFKTLLKLTQETQTKDQPFIDTINSEIIIAIDAAMTSETEYRVEYDINTTLILTDGPLQKQRIINSVLAALKLKGYVASIQTIDEVDLLVITWTIATLTKAT